MTVSIRDNSYELDRLLAMTANRSDSFVKIGYLGGELREDDSSLTMAQVAAFNEFGTKDIPSRPFMSEGFNEANKTDYMTPAVQAVLDGRLSRRKALTMVGLFVRKAIQKKIKAGPWESNSQATIDRKGSERPLIDTGAMRAGLTTAVHVKGD